LDGDAVQVLQPELRIKQGLAWAQSLIPVPPRLQAWGSLHAAVERRSHQVQRVVLLVVVFVVKQVAHVDWPAQSG
jgi:hypothetical protein